MKKITSIVLTLVMILSLFTAFAVSADASDAVLIDYGSKWKYVVYEEDPAVGLVHEAPQGWLDGTDTAEWETGTAPIGDKVYGGNCSVTRYPYQYYSSFLRKSFTVSDLTKVTSLTLYIKYDENPTVYLNGTEVWSATGYVDSRYVEVSLNDRIDLLQEGVNTLQVAISNVNGGGVLDIALLCIDAFEPLLPIASEWQFLAYERTVESNEVETPAPAGWLNKTDSESWATGPAPFSGTAWTNALADTVIPFNWFDAYLRTTFTLDTLDGVNSLLLRVIYDEDPVIYLNGTEIWSATGYKDRSYQPIFINDKISNLKVGENVVCVYFRNKVNGGGSVFDMGLYYNAEEPALYDEDGYILNMTATCSNVYSFGDLNKPENILDGSQNTVCGSGFNANNPQTFTAHFSRPEMITEVYLQCKYEGEYNDGHYGTYNVFAVYGGEETQIGTNVPAIIAAAGGYTLTLAEPIPAEAVTVKVVDWPGPGWACLADIAVKATGETPEAPVYDSQGHILNMTASRENIGSFGAINDPSNILDGDQNTVCGDGGAGNVHGQTLIVTFPKAEEVTEIYLQCKRENNTDGQYGTYDVYAVLNGEEGLIAAAVPAIIAADGGYTLTLTTPVPAEAIKVKVATWDGPGWACLADIAVKASGNAPAAAFSWGEWSTVVPATCAEGLETRECTVCHVTQQRAIAPVAEHTWNDGEVVLSPTTEAEGSILYTCTVCGETKTEAIPVLKPVSYDVNGDGELSIEDVTSLLDLLSHGTSDLTFDLDQDGEVGIADVTAILDALSRAD